jgi:hypothetical protein
MRDIVRPIQFNIEIIDINPPNNITAILTTDEHLATINFDLDEFKWFTFKLGSHATCMMNNLSEEQIKMLWDTAVPIRKADKSLFLTDYLHFTSKFADEERRKNTPSN